VFNPIGDHSQRWRLDRRDRLLTGTAVCERARNFPNISNPTPVNLALDFNRKLHAESNHRGASRSGCAPEPTRIEGT
jgi:hypothetical protein